MSREIDLNTRNSFFPNSKTGATKVARGETAPLRRNTVERESELQGKTSGDAKVEITDAVRDFARIKSAVDAAPAIDNSEKIARLKSQIQKGEYQVNYDEIADRMLSQEF
ncbi:MAG: flagellar biosynthesis anti-sigma factor FlgM [Bacteriovoracaceae bacterium]|nr:flagellar biosynthesis anti-sigma factor FlgM [Bacteriovoracaceae bacterium]